MKKKAVLFILILMAAVMFSAAAADDVVGFWKTVDDKTGETKSILAIYMYKNKLYGRIVATYADGVVNATIHRPTKKAEGWPDPDKAPYYCGLDIIWELKDKGNKWKGGTIMDPEEGKKYASEIWLDGDVMKVRGELRVFGVSTGIGRSQNWYPMQRSELPSDIQDFSLDGIKPDIRTP